MNDAVDGLMMVIDGVTGSLGDGTRSVHLATRIRLTEDAGVIAELPLSEGDGACMAYHSWLEGNFGETPVVTRL